MINSVFLDKIRTSVVTKIAGLFVLAALAIGFFVLPFGAFAAVPSAQLFGIYESCGAQLTVNNDNKNMPQYMLAPYLDTRVSVTKLDPSGFFDAVFNGQHVTGMYLNKTSHQAVLMVKGKPVTVTIGDGNIVANNSTRR